MPFFLMTGTAAGAVRNAISVGGVSAAAKQAGAAKELIKFLTAPSALPVIKKKGMEPEKAR